MPKIPAQLNRRSIQSVGGGGGNARSLGSKAGEGAQAAGAAIASGAGALGQAFAAAQRRRDAAAARLDSLAQETQAHQISLDGRVAMQKDLMDVEEQLKKQQHLRPEEQRVKFKDENGEETEGAPDLVMQTLIQRRYDNAKSDAAQYAGPEAQARVAASLEKDAFESISTFRTNHLKMRHDKELADFKTVADRLEGQAADPTNRFRETAKQDLDDYITKAAQSGVMSPTDAVKVKEGMKKSIADKYYTQVAVQDPVKFLEMVKKRGGGGEPNDSGGTTTVPGQPPKLPDDMDPTKVDGYVNLANAQINNFNADIERVNKRNAARNEQASQDAYNDILSKAAKADTSVDIEQNRSTLGPRYDDALKFNHEWNNARRTEQTRATTDMSQYTQYDLLDRASMAKYVPELLDPTNPDAITNAVVRQHVTGQKDLLPEHASPILEKINEAIAYQNSGDSKQRQAQRDGFKMLDQTFYAPQTLSSSSSFELKRLEQDARAQLASIYDKNPNADPNELALKLAAKFTPRVLKIQKVKLDELDDELLTMEKAWPKGIAGDQHTLNDGTRKQLEKQNPILRGVFALYDAKVERFKQLQAEGQRIAEQSDAKP